MGETTYIKGRDFFDLDWYLTNNIHPNYTLLKNALKKAGPYKGQELTIDNNWLKKELQKKLSTLDWNLARLDMTNFLLEGSFDDLDKIFQAKLMIQKVDNLFS